MDKKVRISYLTIEDLFSGLFSTQVQSPLLAIAEQNPEVKFRLYVINYFWKFFGKKEKFNKIRRALYKKNIEITVIPLLIPVKFTMLNYRYCKLFLSFLTFLIAFLPRSEILHCRGYFTTIAAIKAGRREKIVFDMRSLWVLENIAAGTLIPQSPLYEFWSESEHFAVRRSDAIVGVTEAMRTHVSDLGGSMKYWTVPISVDLKAFEFCNDTRVRLRSQYGWNDDDVVAVYSGSFGLAGLNKKPVGRLLKVLANSDCNLKILILSNESELSVRKVFRDAGIDSSIANIVSLSPGELGAYLSAADLGFHALPDQPDSNTRLGTKTVEYWANGLPVVLSSTVGAAANICVAHDLGIVLDLNSAAETKLKVLPTRRMKEYALKTFDIEQFGLRRVSELYTGIYHHILS